MLHIRTVRTKGNSRSVHVYYYRKGKRVIVKHIGSGTTDAEIVALNEMAKLFIADRTRQTYSSKILHLMKMKSWLVNAITSVFTIPICTMCSGRYSTSSAIS